MSHPSQFVSMPISPACEAGTFEAMGSNRSQDAGNPVTPSNNILQENIEARFYIREAYAVPLKAKSMIFTVNKPHFFFYESIFLMPSRVLLFSLYILASLPKVSILSLSAGTSGLTSCGPSGDPAPTSISMDRGQGLSNNSINSSTSNTSSWTNVSLNTSLTPASPMSSWEEVTPHIKWEDSIDSIDNAEYSPNGSQGFQTPIFPPSSFTEPAITDTRPTPTSLGWSPYSQLLNLYKFVVAKQKDPYFELQEGYGPTYQTPPRVFLDYPEEPKKGAPKSYPCQYPWGCTGKQTVFTRPADLERHYKNVHASSDQKDSFRCDYPKCVRYHEPFTRKDHYRDHLRDYHKEDIGCAKGEKKIARREWAAVQKAWLAERKNSSRWWRCARCLVRRQVNEDGWECSGCKNSCEQERVDARLKQQARSRASHAEVIEVDEEPGYQTASSATMTITSASTAEQQGYYETRECGTCREYPGWADNGVGEWIECPECTPRAAEAGYPVQQYSYP
ncbi:uncharacterized protein PAC_10415 [Phialocephala subalpina]|uniref:C2H2-type domain-containing protein n=1 Tax=Phialocephala subalpina TaxID=576137 RepID=A0A1L7X666_9HELO|nr:uncharacterized protein PAC_10415 [Phialocephala subalpina]